MRREAVIDCLTATAGLMLLMFSAMPPAALAQDSSRLAANDTVTSMTKPGPPEPSYLEPSSADESTPILGRKVIGPDGNKLGLITDVIVDRDGRPRAAVIDFGGFRGRKPEDRGRLEPA
jgi:hypothetical protein